MIASHTKYNHSFLWCVVVLCWFCACESAVEIELPDQSRNIVVDANFTTGQELRVTLAKEKTPLQNQPTEYLHNASVVLTDLSEGSTETLDLVPLNPPYYKTRLMRPVSGRSYRLEIDQPDRPLIYAEDYIPEPVKLRAVEVDTIESLIIDQKKWYKVVIRVIIDDPQVINFYHLRLFDQITPHHEQESAFNYNGEEPGISELLSNLEPAATNPSMTLHHDKSSFLFSDAEFTSSETALVFYTLLAAPVQQHQITAELRTVSNAYYLFQTSLSRQKENEHRPFAEPVTVYSNIENGVGIFAGFSSYRDSTNQIIK